MTEDAKPLAWWSKVHSAVAIVESGIASRVDGEGFKTYAVANGVIRVDIQPKKEDRT